MNYYSDEELKRAEKDMDESDFLESYSWFTGDFSSLKKYLRLYRFLTGGND